MAHFLKDSKVRAAFKAKGKRVKKEAIQVLDIYVQDCIARACAVFNGHRKTVDETVMIQVVQAKRNES